MGSYWSKTDDLTLLRTSVSRPLKEPQSIGRLLQFAKFIFAQKLWCHNLGFLIYFNSLM